MKKWTKIYLNIPLSAKSQKKTLANIQINAKRAQKILGIPQDLWEQMTFESFCSEKAKSIKSLPDMFMLGFICGFAECNEKIK